MDYYDLITKSIEYIENIAYKKNQIEIAKYCCVSSYHFNKIFKIYVGISVSKYINRIRVLKSMPLLKDMNKKIIEVAFEVGFNSPEIFIRNFKKFVNMTPSQFRKENYQFNIELFIPQCVKSPNINHRGGVILCPEIKSMDGMRLYGYKNIIQGNEADNKAVLLDLGKKLRKATNSNIVNDEIIDYALVKCMPSQEKTYDVFIGNKIADSKEMTSKDIPGVMVAEFAFQGDAFDVSHVFENNFYAWVITKKINLIDYDYNMMLFKKNDGKTVVRIPIKL